MSTPYYKLMDLSLLLLASICAYWFRFKEPTLPLDYLIVTTIYSISAVLSLNVMQFYNAINSQYSAKKIIALLSGIALASLLTSTFLYLTKTGDTYSRIWFLATCMLSFIFLLAPRFLLARFFRLSIGQKSIVLVGANQTASRINKQLQRSEATDQGINLLHHFSSKQGDESIDKIIQRALAFIDMHRSKNSREGPVTEIWLTADIFSGRSSAELELELTRASVIVVYVPEMPAMEKLEISKLENVLGIPTINSGFRKSIKINGLLKYLEDKIGAALLLILLSPLLILISILIKLDSRGPIIFRQARHGFGGREFDIFKFRTMHTASATGEFHQATAEDNRVTGIGRWLRRSSLDELPQLFNVLNGSMSLVGPRPHPIELNEDYEHLIDSYMARHAIKPGITGLAQINGFRGETITLETMEGRIHHDLKYVGNWSLLLDLKILGLTVLHIFTTDQAY